MAYSTAYQNVVAGRVREEESVVFIRDNKIATHSRTTSISNIGGKAEPTLETEHLDQKGAGKAGVISDDKSAYVSAGQTLS